MNKKENNRPRIVAFMNHPAHYTDAVFNEMLADDRISLNIIYYNNMPTDHKEWKRQNDIDSRIYYCKRKYTIWKGEYYNPDAIRRFMKGKYDLAIISGRMPFTSYILLKICQRKKIPYIFASDTALLPIKRKIGRNEEILFHKKYDWIIHNAKGIWTPGAAGRAWWNAIYGKSIDANIVEGRYLLERGNLPVRLSRLESREVIRKRLSLQENDFVILFVGELIPSRNLRWFLNIQQKLIKEGYFLKLLVIGFGEESRYIKAYMRRHPADIRYIEGVSYEQLNDYYLASDCYIHPGTEPYSLALVQAVLDYIPVISTEVVGAAYDYVIDKRNGYIVPIHDDKKWEEAIISVIEGQLKNISESIDGKELLEDRTAKRIADRLISLIES